MTATAPVSRRAVDRRVILLSVMALSALYVGWHLDRGWFPVDDGALAHSAERVLRGELPHRDFDDVYTGGLAFLNAVAFRVAGISFWTMRVVVFAVFLAWVPAVFGIASRFVRPLAAAGVALLAVIWSLPNYTAPMPSWYNLFLATFGITAVLRHLDDPRRRWLVLAGIAGGLSVLVKVVGLYYIAGVLFFIVYQTQADMRGGEGGEGRRALVYPAFITAALTLFVAMLAALVRRQAYLPEIVHFIVPGALIAVLLMGNEWRNAQGTSRERFQLLVRRLLPFLAGVALPIALFLVPYALSGAIGALLNGVFILPSRRFGSASSPMLPLSSLLTLLLPAGVLALGMLDTRRQRSRGVIALVALVLALVVIASARRAPLYQLVWNSARTALPMLAVAAVVFLARARLAERHTPLMRSQAMLLLCVTTMCSLVQFPFSVAVYFCYVAPLVILTAAALFRFLPPMNPAAPIMLGAFYGTFALARVNSGAQYGMGRFYLSAASIRMRPLPGDRAGIDAPRAISSEYEAITYLLRQHARGGYTWAAPDSPEIYVLSGLGNPTRSLYEFFDDSAGHSDRILRALDARQVTAIVVNRKPPFSRPLDPALLAALSLRYPSAAEIGPYVVRWRKDEAR